MRQEVRGDIGVREKRGRQRRQGVRGDRGRQEETGVHGRQGDRWSGETGGSRETEGS